MQLHASLRARNPQQTARTGSWILFTVLVLDLALAAFPGLALEQRLVMLVSALFFGACGVVYRVTPPDRLDRRGGFVLVSALGPVSTAAILAWKGEGGELAPTLILVAVLWAATSLHAGGAWLIATVSTTAYSAAQFVVNEPVDAVATSMFLGAGSLLVAAVVSRSMDQQAALTQKLTAIADHDALTGLATRRAFDEAVGIALTGHTEEKGTALVLVDMDRFKTINDVHGHPVGDQALQHVSAILTGSVRARDSVVGRLGGDELAVLLAGCPADVAERRARDLWQAVRATPLVLGDGTTLQLTVSVGVAHAPPSGQCASELYAAADGALYTAKRGGRDAVAVAG